MWARGFLVAAIVVCWPISLSAQDNARVAIVPNIGDIDLYAGLTPSSVFFSPNGKLLASFDSFGIKLWDVATGRLLRVLRHDPLVMTVAFFPDSTHLASGHKDGKIKIWDLATGRSTATINAGSNWIRSVWIDDAGSRLISGDQDGIVKIWSVKDLRVLRQFAIKSYLAEAQLTIDRRGLIAVGGTGGSKFDLATGNAVASFTAQNGDTFIETGIIDDGRLISIRAKPDCTDSEVRVLDLKSAGNSVVLDQPVQCGGAKTDSYDEGVKVFSDPGHPAVVIARKGAGIKIFNRQSLQLERSVKWPDGAELIALDREHRLAVSHLNGSFQILKFDSGEVMQVLAGTAASAGDTVLSSDDRAILLSQIGREAEPRRNAITLWDMNRLAPTNVRVPADTGNGAVHDFSLTVKTAVGSSKKGELILISLETGNELRRFAVPEIGSIWSARLSPDGKLVVVVGEKDSKTDQVDSSAVLMSVDDQRVMRVFKAGENQGYLHTVEFTADGNRLAIARRRGGVELWSTKPLQKIRQFSTREEDVDIYSLRFSNDGKILLGGSLFYSRIFLWNVEDGRLVREFEDNDAAAHYPYPASLALSHDGKLLAAGYGQRNISSGDEIAERGSIRVWDVATGKQLLTIRGHEGLVKSITFSPGDRWIVSASHDGTIRYWDRNNGKLVATFAALPDGRWLMLTASGYFAGSRDAGDLLSFVRGLEIMPMDRVRDRLFRPDLVSQLIAGDRKDEYGKAARALDLDRILDPN